MAIKVLHHQYLQGSSFERCIFVSFISNWKSHESLLNNTVMNFPFTKWHIYIFHGLLLQITFQVYIHMINKLAIRNGKSVHYKLLRQLLFQVNIFTQPIHYKQGTMKGQFFCRAQLIWIQRFLSPRLVAIPRQKIPIYLTINLKGTTKGKFFCRVQVIWIQRFPSSWLVAIPRLKILVYLTINLTCSL